MSWVVEHAWFVRSFLRHPIRTGALAPSSRWLAEAMVAGLELHRARTVVEVGAGTGSFTGRIVRASHRNALVMAVELEPAFARRLAVKFPEVRVIEGSVECLPAFLHDARRRRADCILSSLPWASFPPALQDRLLSAIVASLKPGGRFATYAYASALWMPGARRFRRLLARRFASVRRSAVVWRNLPPAFVYRCVKTR